MEYSISAARKGAATGEGGAINSVRVSGKNFVLFLWSFAAPYKSSLLLALGVSLPMVGITGAIPWILNRATDLLSTGSSLSTVLYWMALGLAALILKSALEITTGYILTILHIRITNDIRNDLYEKIHKSPLEFHSQNRSGEIASLISNDVQAAAGGVLEIYSMVWQSPASVILLFCVMFYFNPLMSVVGLLSIPVMTVCVMWSSKRARKAERNYLDRQGRMLGEMIEALTNVRQVKSFGMEGMQKEKVAARGEEMVGYRRKALLLKSIVSPLAEITSAITVAIMVTIAYYQISNDMTTTGAVVGCIAAALSMKRPLKRISGSVVEVQRSMAAVQRITWLRRQAHKEQGREPVGGRFEHLRLENVSFSYDGRNYILKDVDLEIRRGDRLAIVGPSGAGKSTLIDILIGFYPCTSGATLVNGKDLATIDPASWREKIGIVSQETLLFDATIEENIRHGYPRATRDRITEAAKMAGCSEMLSRLAEGLDTVVGERGARLSGGERKRVALARALVRPIEILVLDEATSELDWEVERDILDCVNRLQDITVISASHRPSVMKYCDRAIALGGGHVREISPEATWENMTGGINRAGESPSRDISAN